MTSFFFFKAYRSFARGIECLYGLWPRTIEVTCSVNLRAISDLIYVRGYAIHILGIECPKRRTEATEIHETLPRATASRFFSSLPPPRCLATSSRHAARGPLFFMGPSRGVKEARPMRRATAVILASRGARASAAKIKNKKKVTERTSPLKARKQHRD